MEERSFGRALRDARRAKRLNQRQLGEVVGVAQQAVSQWEAGKTEPDLGTVVSLASALGIEPAELLPRDREPVRRLTLLRRGEGAELTSGQARDAGERGFIEMLSLRLSHGPLTDAEVALFRDLARAVFKLNLSAPPDPGCEKDPGS